MATCSCCNGVIHQNGDGLPKDPKIIVWSNGDGLVGIASALREFTAPLFSGESCGGVPLVKSGLGQMLYHLGPWGGV